MTTPIDRGRQDYERACTEGRFHADSYHPFKPGSIEREKHQVHLVQFTAYDGYRVIHYTKTRAEADRIAAEMNELGSVEAVDAYREKLRKEVDGAN